MSDFSKTFWLPILPATMLRIGLTLYAVVFALNSLSATQDETSVEMLTRITFPLVIWGALLLLATAFVARIFAKKSAVGLDEQTVFLQKPAWTGFFSPFLWSLANKQYGQALLAIIPFVNTWLGFKIVRSGRAQSWQSGKWLGFDSFKRRQQMLRFALPVFYVGLGATGFVALLLVKATPLAANLAYSLTLFAKAFALLAQGIMGAYGH